MFIWDYIEGMVECWSHERGGDEFSLLDIELIHFRCKQGFRLLERMAVSSRNSRRGVSVYDSCDYLLGASSRVYLS